LTLRIISRIFMHDVPSGRVGFRVLSEFDA